VREMGWHELSITQPLVCRTRLEYYMHLYQDVHVMDVEIRRIMLEGVSCLIQFWCRYYGILQIALVKVCLFPRNDKAGETRDLLRCGRGELSMRSRIEEFEVSLSIKSSNMKRRRSEYGTLLR